MRSSKDRTGADRERQCSREEKTRHQKKLLQKRLGMRRLRQRAKDHKRDPLRYYPTPLLDSVAHHLAADLEIKPADDKPITNQQWRTLIGGVLAAVALKMVRKK